jgi:hypothetical protein
MSHDYLKGFENVDIARSFMLVENTPEIDPSEAPNLSAPDPSSSGQESTVGTPEDESLITKIHQNAIWLSSFVTQLSHWLSSSQAIDLSAEEQAAQEASVNEDIWKDWEWIMSETEKFALQRNSEESESVKRELEELRHSANILKARPIFLQAAKQLLHSTLSNEDVHKLTTRVLDSSKRSKVVADVVTAYVPEWLQFVKELLFADKSETYAAYEDAFQETAYSKGVVGGMKETGWQASHGPGDSGLTYQVLGDITWAFWKTLHSSLRWFLGRELTIVESSSLAEMIAGCQGKLIELWLETVNNSETGAANEGKLPAIWAQEAKEEQARVKEIKCKGAHARYEYVPVVTVSTQENRKKLGELKNFLESRLQFRTV